MKKSLLLAFAAMLFCSVGSLKAQNCEQIVLPHVGYSTNMLDNMCDAKIDWYCAFSHQSFFVADELPQGVTPHSISEVRNVSTGEHLPATFQVDLATLSLYAYDFEEFRVHAAGQRVYFSTPGSAHAYLVLRTDPESMALVNEVWHDTDYDAEGNRISR